MTLLKRRPHFQDASRHSELVIAKFVYSPTIGAWSLKWRDRNERWHPSEGFEQMPHGGDALREVEADAIGIFLG